MMHSQSATNELQAIAADAISSEELLGAALTAATTQLTEFAKSPTALHALDQAFDVTVPDAAETLLEDWASGVFGQLPALEILADATLQGAQGAYSAATNTVYLAESLDSLTGLTEVLLEEFGHYIDTQVNPGADSAGDEGAIFAAIAAGIELIDAELASLQAEDDFGEIIVDGEAIVVEQSTSPDFNGDGNPDILWRNSSGDNAAWFMGGADSTNQIGSGLFLNVGGDWDIKGVADFDGDTNPDILWRRPSTGENVVWFMGGTNNTVRESFTFLADVGGDWDIKGVADFNGDSNPDILWRRPSTGENVVWFMGGANNTVRESFTYLLSVGGSWDIKGATSFDGKNGPDILWRNASTGENAVWFMGGNNNTERLSFDFLDTLSPSTGWDIKAVAGNKATVVNEVDLGLQSGSASVKDATTVSFSATVQNAGTDSTGTTTDVKYWLDSNDDGLLDESVDTSITPNTPTTVSSISAGGFQTISAEFVYDGNWPGEDAGGDYVILAKVDADDAVTETNEDNNTLAASVTIAPQAPDLQITSTTVTSQVETGDTFRDFEATVTNSGRDDIASSFEVSAYISDDSTGSDVLLGTQTVSSLAGSGQTTVDFTPVNTSQPPSGFTWDVGETYTIFFEADSGEAVTEADENNNVGDADVGIVAEGALAPDLLIPTAEVTLNDVPLTDTDNDGKVEIRLDQSVLMNITVKNDGIGTALSYDVFTYLSTDDTPGSDYQIEDLNRAIDVGLSGGAETDINTPEVTFDSVFSGIQFTPSQINFLLFEANVFDTTDQAPDSDDTNNFFALPVEFTNPPA